MNIMTVIYSAISDEVMIAAFWMSYLENCELL